MKRHILFLSLLLPIVAFGQGKLSIGFTLNASFSQMKIDTPGFRTGDTNEYGSVGTGYAAGLQIQYKLTKLFLVESGIVYQNMKHRHRVDGLRFPNGFNVKIGNIQNDIILSSIGIPMKLGRYLNREGGKTNYYAGVFGMINLYLNKSSEAVLIFESTNETDVINSVNQIDGSFYSLGLFGGFDTKIGEKFFLGAELNLRYTPNRFVLSIYQSTASTLLEAGITFKIGMR